MQFVYKPEGAEPRKWDFKPGKLMSPEAEALERLTGGSFVDWVQSLQGGSMLAARAYVYVLLKRENPTLTFEQVQICLDDIDWETDVEESREIIDELERRRADRELTPDEEQALSEAQRQLAEASADAPVAVGAGTPKD